MDLVSCKLLFYIIMAGCFGGASVCEFFIGNYRMGAVSLLLGVVQALVFLGGEDNGFSR